MKSEGIESLVLIARIESRLGEGASIKALYETYVDLCKNTNTTPTPFNEYVISISEKLGILPEETK